MGCPEQAAANQVSKRVELQSVASPIGRPHHSITCAAVGAALQEPRLVDAADSAPAAALTLGLFGRARDLGQEVRRVLSEPASIPLAHQRPGPGRCPHLGLLERRVHGHGRHLRGEDNPVDGH